MITLTFQFNDIASAAALLANLNGQQLAAVVPSPAPAVVKAVAATANMLANEAALADTVEAPGKPAKAVKPAATPSTAPASDASPKSSEPVSSTTPPADALAAPAEFDYATLQKAVNAAVPRHGKDKLLAIAKAHGADNFKGLPASAWAAAHADVVALG